MKTVQIRSLPLLIAFLLPFVHGDVHAKTLGLRHILNVTPALEGPSTLQVIGRDGPVRLTTLPFVVVETHHSYRTSDWLVGYELKALGASGRFWRVACPSQVQFQDFLRTMHRHPEIKSGFPDVLLKSKRLSITVDDPKYPAQWYLEQLNAEVLWAKSFGDAQVKVAVIDSGIDIAHPDLSSKIIAPKDTWDDDVDPSPNAGEFCFAGNQGICDEHGTAVSGIILADANDLNIIGICPDCSLIPIKMLGDGYVLPTSTTLSGDVAAFEHAIAQDAAVINNSWGFNESIPVPAPLASIIQIAATQNRGGKGAVVIFAAGNEDREVTHDELSGLDVVLSISATDRYGNPTPYTNRGASIDLAAPAATLSLAPGGGITESFGGTSSAAPVVSGVAAWILSVKPELTAAEVRDLLRDTARPDPRYAYDDEGHNELVGYGLLDLDALVTALYPVEEDIMDVADEPEPQWGCQSSNGSFSIVSLSFLWVLWRRRFKPVSQLA